MRHTKRSQFGRLCLRFSSVIQSQGCKTMCGVNPGMPLPASIKPEYSTISQKQPLLSSSILWCTLGKEIDHLIITHFTSAMVVLENMVRKLSCWTEKWKVRMISSKPTPQWHQYILSMAFLLLEKFAASLLLCWVHTFSWFFALGFKFLKKFWLCCNLCLKAGLKLSWQQQWALVRRWVGQERGHKISTQRQRCRSC